MPLKPFLELYPEFAPVVKEIARDTCMRINSEARFLKTTFPYVAQAILEEVIKDLEARV